MLVRIGDWPFIPVGGDLSLKFYHEPPANEGSASGDTAPTGAEDEPAPAAEPVEAERALKQGLELPAPPELIEESTFRNLPGGNWYRSR